MYFAVISEKFLFCLIIFSCHLVVAEVLDGPEDGSDYSYQQSSAVSAMRSAFCNICCCLQQYLNLQQNVDITL